MAYGFSPCIDRMTVRVSGKSCATRSATSRPLIPGIAMSHRRMSGRTAPRRGAGLPRPRTPHRRRRGPAGYSGGNAGPARRRVWSSASRTRIGFIGRSPGDSPLGRPACPRGSRPGPRSPCPVPRRTRPCRRRARPSHSSPRVPGWHPPRPEPSPRRGRTRIRHRGRSIPARG